MTWSVDQTIVKMKKKNQIIVIVMMWGRPEFINDRNLKGRFKGFWEDSAVRSSKNFARRIPMPGIEPGPWRWKSQILNDEFQAILRAFFTFVKSFFNESTSLSELIVLKIMWGRHEFSTTEIWDVGIAFHSAARALKNIARRIPMPGIELGPWRWARECQMLTTRSHGMSIVQIFSSTSVVALGIPMPGIEPGPWRWKRQILIDEFHVDILRAFFDVCKIFFQWKCIIVRIDCSKDYVGETRIYQRQKSGT